MKVLFVLCLAMMALAAFSVQAQSGGCTCTLEYSPVCGTDGKTYPNRCRATCRGIEVAYTGPCGGGSSV